VHYAGVACAMHEIMIIAKKHNLFVIEDAAQGIGSTYRGHALGTLGTLGALSFHGSKNIISGEGGALLINNEPMKGRAEIIREKGTDRSCFVRGEVDKYRWQDIGSSFLPSDIIAAVLLTQLSNVQLINEQRLAIWYRYHTAFIKGERDGLFRRPTIPQDCEHNAHIYYLVFNGLDAREHARRMLKRAGITASTHYTPLHKAPAARHLGRISGTLAISESISDGLLRLPLYFDLSLDEQDRVIEAVCSLNL
jgi:dTDP-4-amino-4,6-dideoxygalactose transaminase